MHVPAEGIPTPAPGKSFVLFSYSLQERKCFPGPGKEGRASLAAEWLGKHTEVRGRAVHRSLTVGATQRYGLAGGNLPMPPFLVHRVRGGSEPQLHQLLFGASCCLRAPCCRCTSPSAICTYCPPTKNCLHQGRHRVDIRVHPT